MLLIPEYTVNLELKNYPESFKYTEPVKGHEIKSIDKNNPIFIKLKIFLMAEKNGWKYDIFTYTHKHFFYSPFLAINCLDDSVVINYKDGTEWVQISKNIKNACKEVL